MQSFNMNIQYIPGKHNVVADALSRLFTVEESTENVGGCEPTITASKDVPYIGLELYELILQAHNKRVGHRGVLKTARILRRQGHSWKGMTQDIKSFIARCPTCQMLQTRKNRNNPAPYAEAAKRTHERINVDTLYATPADEEGYSYVLVIIDCFTRWVELYPLKSLNAYEAASTSGDTGLH
jgi:hypothetical protein